MDEHRETRRQEAHDRRMAAITAMLEPDEEIEAFLVTYGIMKKCVCLTSKRVIVADDANVTRVESILYRAINGYSTSNFITKDLRLAIASRRDDLELRFETEAGREAALRALQAHLDA